MLAEWALGGDKIGVSQRVVTRGDAWDGAWDDAWDDALNTNNTVAITTLTACQIGATGSNT